jgi:hypothetical protein
LTAFFAQLHQAAGGRKTGWSTANNHNVKFHGFAFYLLLHCNPLFPVMCLSTSMSQPTLIWSAFIAIGDVLTYA